MDMSRNFTSLMMTSSGSHGSLSRSTLASSLGDVQSPSGAQDDGKVTFSKVLLLTLYICYVHQVMIMLNKTA